MQTSFLRAFIAALFFLLYCFVFLHLATLWRLNQDLKQAQNFCVETEYRKCVESLIYAARWENAFTSQNLVAANSAFKVLKERDVFLEHEKIELLWKLRRALYSSRHIFRPETKAQKSELLTKIDKLLAIDLENDRHLEEVRDPRQVYQMLSHVFFWLWIIAFLLAIWRGLDAELKLKPAPFFTRLCLSGVGFFAWLGSLYLV